MIYLPLDKLTERRAPHADARRAATVTTAPSGPRRPRQTTPDVTIEARRERGSADGQPRLPGRDRRSASLVLAAVDGGVHRARDRARDQVPLRRDRARRLQAGPALHGAVRQQRAQVRPAHPHRGLPRRAVPDQRRQDPAHRLLREVAHRRRVALLHRDRRRHEEVANRRLGEIVKDGIKGVIARRTIQQVVAAERTEFLGEMLKIAGRNVSELGISWSTCASRASTCPRK